MKLAHVALWCRDLDRATAFWVEHFGAQAGERYASTRRPGFVSRFVRFDEGATLELMSIPGLEAHAAQAVERPGPPTLPQSVTSKMLFDHEQALHLESDTRHTRPEPFEPPADVPFRVRNQALQWFHTENA